MYYRKLITLLGLLLLNSCDNSNIGGANTTLVAESTCTSNLKKLQLAYPNYIVAVNFNYITWEDGTKIPSGCEGVHDDPIAKNESPTLADQVVGQYQYKKGVPWSNTPYVAANEPGRARYIPMFLKMYGASKEKVESNLVYIYWMPKTFGTQYVLRVTTINNVYKKFIKISQELDNLVYTHPEYKVYLLNPAGTFCWRVIAGTERLSPHSFGMTIDINTKKSNYWRWDLESSGVTNITENMPLTYRNQIPQQIIDVFESNNFIWGGKWYHYDTMHFEYRPELFN